MLVCHVVCCCVLLLVCSASCLLLFVQSLHVLCMFVNCIAGFRVFWGFAYVKIVMIVVVLFATVAWFVLLRVVLLCCYLCVFLFVDVC